MKIEIIREIPDDEGVRASWNGLVRQMEQPEIFYTYEWARAVQSAYAQTLPPLLVCGYQGNELAGVVALTQHTDGRSVSFLTRTTGDYCDFVSRPELRSEFVRATLGALRRIGICNIWLANLPALSATSRCLPKLLGQAGFYYFSHDAYRCARVDTVEPVPTEAGSQELQRKQNIRRKMKKLEPLVLKHLAPDGVQEFLPQFALQHVSRFLAHGQLSNLIQPERRAFLRDLAYELGRTGWLKFTQLESAGVPVASNYGFQFEGHWFWYQPTFDWNYAKQLPGLCLLTKIVEEANRDSTVTLVDLGLGEEEYKTRMATGHWQTRQVTASRSILSCAYRGAVYLLAKTVKRSARAERLARKVSVAMADMESQLAIRGAAAIVPISKSLAQRAAHHTRLCFFEWPDDPRPRDESGELFLRPVDLELLSSAAMRLAKDNDALTYLCRAAQRLRSGTSRAFALTSGGCEFLHFCWTTQFEGFALSEIQHCLRAPGPASELIYDCWTPLRHREKGYYIKAVSLLGSKLRGEGTPAWIFSASTNVASMQGIEKAGFVKRFSISQWKIFGRALPVKLSSVKEAETQIVGPLLRAETT